MNLAQMSKLSAFLFILILFPNPNFGSDMQKEVIQVPIQTQVVQEQTLSDEKNKVKISDTYILSLLEDPLEIIQYNFLMESPMYDEILSAQERKIVEQFSGMGIQIVYVKSKYENDDDVLGLKYIFTNLFEDVDHEFIPIEWYTPEKFLRLQSSGDQATSASTSTSTVFSTSLNELPLKEVASVLKHYLLKGNVMKVLLIISYKPESIDELSNNFWAKILFSGEALCGNGFIIKEFILLHSPKSFISALILAYKIYFFKSDLESQTELLEILLNSLLNVFCPNANVQEAFRFALNTFDCPIKILSTFTTLKLQRPITLNSSESEMLKTFILMPDSADRDNDNYIKERMALLTGINVDVKMFIETIITESIKIDSLINSSNLETIFKFTNEILLKKELVNKLDANFIMSTLIKNAIKSESLLLMKAVFTQPIIERIKLIPNYEKLIFFILNSDNEEKSLELLNFLVNLKSVKYKYKLLFKREYFISIGFRALNLKKTKLVMYLIEKNLVSLGDKAKIPKYGKAITLLAFAVETNLIEFVTKVNEATIISWYLCADCFSVNQSPEMRTLLTSLTAGKFNNLSGIVRKREEQTAPSTSTNSILSDVLKNEEVSVKKHRY